MRVAVFDADLVGRKKHRFPNLVCMKISAYHKSLGDDVELETKWTMFPAYDKVYVSKVFTDTPVNERCLNMPNVVKGGTGFYFDKAPPLPYEIEHIMPDYHLYDEWLGWVKRNGMNMRLYDMYLNHSIGFLTRGCFRHCPFCVNKYYRQVVKHSPLEEFYDPSRKIITLLDDNFLGYHGWRELWEQLVKTKKYFVFKQGLDVRLLNDLKCEVIFNTKRYYQNFIFAFDNIEDEPIIVEKLKLIRRHTKSPNFMFYVFTGLDKNDRYDDDFWRMDLANVFRRLTILAKYGMRPYLMRYKAVHESKLARAYQFLCMWTNQPRMYSYLTLEEFNETMKRTHSENNMNSKDYEELLKWIPKGSEKIRMKDLKECDFDELSEKQLDESHDDEV